MSEWNIEDELLRIADRDDAEHYREMWESNPGIIRKAHDEILSLRAQLAAARDALKIIEGGHYDTASSMVLSGNWQQLVNAMQATAREALKAPRP